MTSKRHILAEIKRIADASGGKPPGVRLFESETGIKETDWYPNLWLRWGDALQEAGFARNIMQKALTDDYLLERYAGLVRRLLRLPIMGELILESKTDPTFPSEKTYRRFGGKPKLLRALVEYCRSRPEYNDVLAVSRSAVDAQEGEDLSPEVPLSKITTGFVYLVKSGRHYKIGRTNSLGRRQWELGIKIPVPPKSIHHIETDDPVGVEAYWHKRFEAKRGEGEWFSLGADEVAAFKRWKRIS